MAKLMLVVRRSPGIEPAEIHERAKRLPDVDGVVGWVANVADESQAPLGDEIPTAEAVVEAWLAPGRDVASVPLDRFLPGLAVEVYEVEERLMWDRHGEWPLGERAVGFNRIALIPRLPSLTRAEFAAHWTERHGPLAARHHPGIARYVQNVVIACHTPGAPDWDGIAELHFVRLEDFTERMHDSPEGKRIIREDVRRFIDRTHGERFLLGRWSILHP
ncbi:MAG TPA: EthD domain-containing protein, partial [Acidimicrobiales bacterium]